MKFSQIRGRGLSASLRVYAAFFLYAFALGGLYPRLAEIQQGMGVAEGALGLGLIGTATGTLISLTFGSRWIAQLGAQKILWFGLPLIGVFYAFAAGSSNPWLMFGSLVPAGICIGAVEQVVNLEADRVEYALGRRIMNRAHAFWSTGFAMAGLMGAMAAQWDVSPQSHLLLVAGLVIFLVWVFLGKFEPALLRPTSDHQSTEVVVKFAWPTSAIMMLLAATMGVMLMEGAGIDWSAIYMRDVFASSPFVCGLAVAAGATAQALTRFFADRFVERFQPVRVARCLILIMSIGICFVTWGNTQWLALLGLTLMGVGTSAIFPLAMSAAAQRTDRPAAVNVAALAQTSFVVFLVGPPLLGWVAEIFGIRTTFAVGLPFAVLSFWAAKSLKN
jgi:MFS family permease